MSQTISFSDAIAKIRAILKMDSAEPATEPTQEPVTEPTEPVQEPSEPAQEPTEPTEPVALSEAEKIAELETKLAELTQKFSDLEASVTDKIKAETATIKQGFSDMIDAVEVKLSEPGADPIQTPPNAFTALKKDKSEKLSSLKESFSNNPFLKK